MKKIIRDNRGLSLVEVMMALAVFGLILLFITQMVSTGTRMEASNAERLKMMEVAREHAERVRAGYNEDKSVDHWPKVDTKYEIEYAPSSPGEVVPGTSLLIKVKDAGSNEKYELVIWLPPSPGTQAH